MATVGNTYLNLADLRRQQDRNDNIAPVIEIMAKSTPLMSMAPTMECNQGHEHLTTYRASLPTPTSRRLYEGVAPSKGTTTQVTESTMTLETWSEVDVDLLSAAKNPGQFRLNNATAHLQGLGQTAASKLFYGDSSTDPAEFDGLATRYNSLSAANGNQIIDGAGTGSDNTSIWFITMGSEVFSLLYPEGSSAGVMREDMGRGIHQNADGTAYPVIRERFKLNFGITVQDWRQISCVRNIDVSDLTADASSGENLINQMIRAAYALKNPNSGKGQTVIFCTRTIQMYLHMQAMNNTNVNLTLAEFEGRPVTHFMGFPVVCEDSILETEGHIT